MSAHIKVKVAKVRKRLARKSAIRKRIRGTAARPRMSVFRSLNHIYAQAIDDDSGRTLATASTRDKELAAELAGKKKAEKAKLVGEAIAKKLVGQNVESVIFDRNGFIYHGRVKELAEGARSGGLKF